MAAKYTGLINRLIKGLNYVHNEVYYLDTQQFYSESQRRNITMFIISHRLFDEGKGRYVKQQVLKTATQIDVVKFLADRMKELNEESEA